ncbi:hypothetical protein BT67DRAFT_364926, partial [Trichocladium antarcticum]
DDTLPPLTVTTLTTRPDKAAALRLIADSIAQQRQQSAFAIATHPLPLALLLAALAAVYHFAWASQTPRARDAGTVMMLASGAITTYLLGIRLVTAGYLRAAEAVGWDFLRAPQRQEEEEEEDVVVGTRYGSDLIGALVLRLERPVLDGSTEPKGVIRAWTTKMRYRGKGIGGDMLREAVRVARERLGPDARVEFASDHANGVRVLPGIFEGPVRKSELRAARALERVPKE